MRDERRQSKKSSNFNGKTLGHFTMAGLDPAVVKEASVVGPADVWPERLLFGFTMSKSGRPEFAPCV